MAFIEGTDRFQSQFMDFFTFDNLIADDHYVRVIDAFVNSLDLDALGFISFSGDSRGQKPYHPQTLLKIHIYCFYNGIQSSRKQERECSRNIELIWLTGNLKPDHSTIASFCKKNSAALGKLFKEFSLLCRSLNLYDFLITALDGTKIQACCSKKQVFTIERLDNALLQLDKKIEEYLSHIDNDSFDDDSQLAEFQEKLKTLENRKVQYSSLKKTMIDENISEICLTDPDAKVMKNHSNIQPCYNLQAIVDSKHKLILDFDVTNHANDVGLLRPMADKLIDDYDLNSFFAENPEHILTLLADAGFFKIEDILALNSSNINAIVPKPKSATSTGCSAFSKDNFIYDETNDTYLCPEGNLLTFSRKSTETRNGITKHYKIYSGTSCSSCPSLDKCTTSINGRSIKRNIDEDQLLQLNYQFDFNSSEYKLRKELVEHPFGTIKRSLGFTHVFVKGLLRVSSWASSVFLAYNFKRVFNILGFQKFMEAFTSN